MLSGKYHYILLTRNSVFLAHDPLFRPMMLPENGGKYVTLA